MRLLTASNQEFQGLVTSGQMREDLYFRLNEFTITVTPLRERKDDIPYLAKRFMDLTNKELQKNVRRLSEYCIEVIPGFAKKEVRGERPIFRPEASNSCSKVLSTI